VNEPETAAWMSRLEQLSRGDGGLPDPALIWWKAQLLKRQAARARVTRPMAVAQWTSLVVAVVTVAALAAKNWTGIKDILLEPAGIALWFAVGAIVILMGLALRFVFGE